MIYRKDWEGTANTGKGYKTRVVYRGWFLLGFIPLCIVRI
jgi:hypothetical protein